MTKMTVTLNGDTPRPHVSEVVVIVVSEHEYWITTEEDRRR
jgi:hypothetical protein